MTSALIEMHGQKPAGRQKATWKRVSVWAGVPTSGDTQSEAASGVKRGQGSSSLLVTLTPLLVTLTPQCDCDTAVSDCDTAVSDCDTSVTVTQLSVTVTPQCDCDTFE